MKYIKSFNEAKPNAPIDILRYLCENYLSYLYDNNFNVEITRRQYRSIYEYYMIDISKKNFNFSEIEDELLQFLDYLKSKNLLLDNNLIKFVGDKSGEIDLHNVRQKGQRYYNLLENNLSNIYLIIKMT